MVPMSYHQLPELTVLGGALFAAQCLQLLCAAAQGLGQAQRGEEPGEGLCLLRRGLRLLCRLLEGFERPRNSPAQAIDARKLFLNLRRIFPAVAVRMLPPVAAPRPGAAGSRRCREAAI